MTQEIKKKIDPKTKTKEPSKDAPIVKPPIQQPEGEIGGPEGPEPTRYGDWEQGGRCTDF